MPYMDSIYVGQISIIPKPELFGDLRGFPLLNHRLG